MSKKMKPKQIERLENMVFRMDTLTRTPDEDHDALWVQVKTDLEALSMSLQAWRHAVQLKEDSQ